MKRTIAYTILILTAIAVSFGFSNINQEGKIHLKITKEENGEKSVFEKVYPDMDALKSDEEMKDFDVLIDRWANEDNHVFMHEYHKGADPHKKVIIKKRIDGDQEFTWTSEEHDEIHKDGKKIIIEKIGDDDEIIEVEGEKIIKIKTDGEEKVFTITSDAEGNSSMVWIDEDGNKTKLTEENIQKLAEDGEHVEIHKKIKVITSDDDEGEKKVIIIDRDGDNEMVWIDEDGKRTKLTEEEIAELKDKYKNEEMDEVHKTVEVIVSDEGDVEKNVFIVESENNIEMDVEVEVEKQIDEDGNEVVKDKNVWITKDGKKVELIDEDSFEFKSEGEKVIIKVDDETLDMADFSGGKFDGDDVMVFKSKGSGENSMKQTMNVNIEEKDGEKFIEIDIKRESALNVTISEIAKNDAELNDAKINLKNNLKVSQLSYFPNPNNGKFNLKFNLDHNDEVTVTIMDILGNRVYNEKLMDFEGVYDNEINLVGKEKGIYILQISQKKKVLTRKILIE